MTVGELKALLAGKPDDLRVLVDGYEDGYDEPHVYSGRFFHNPGPGYSGQYDDAEGYSRRDQERTGNPIFDAVVIGR